MHGAPCSTTLHLTFLARQHWHALEARLFTGLLLVPDWLAAEAPLFNLGDAGGLSEAAGEKFSSFMATVSGAVSPKHNSSLVGLNYAAALLAVRMFQITPDANLPTRPRISRISVEWRVYGPEKS